MSRPGCGVKASWWLTSEFDTAGNYSRDRRELSVAAATPQALADVLRALARDIERAAGLRPPTPATTAAAEHATKETPV